MPKSFAEVLEKHEERDKKRDALSIERDSKIENRVEEIHTKIDEAVRTAVKETVNGKIDKVNTNIGWVIKIGYAVIFASMTFDGWLALTTINQGNQVATVVQAVQDLKTK